MIATLWPEQARAINDLRVAYGTHRSVLLRVPTGGGKTVIACEIIRRLVAKGNKAIFLAHRKELIDQCSKKLDSNGIAHGIVAASNPRCQPWQAVQVASVPTIVNRVTIPDANFVVCDEAHHSPSSTFEKVLVMWPKTRILGLTATPWRLDGKGLGKWYEKIVVGATMRELIENGWLVRPRIFSPGGPDLRRVSKVGGDFNRKQLGEHMDKPTLIGDLVKTYQKHAEGRYYVGSAVSIDHAKHCAERFTQAGIPSKHVYSGMPPEERARILAEFANHEITGLWSVTLLSEGYDAPFASCGIVARPTTSSQLFYQIVGRLLRIHPDKQDAIILDHAGNSERLLETGDFLDEPEADLEGVKQKPSADKVPSFRTCLNCYAIAPGTAQVCPECGLPFPRRERIIVEKAGELREMRREGLRQLPTEKKVSLLAGFIREARARGYHPMQPLFKFSGMFGAPATDEERDEAIAIVDAESAKRAANG